MFLSRNVKNIRGFLFENFQFLEVKFSIYLNRRVFIMYKFFLKNPRMFQSLQRTRKYKLHYSEVRGNIVVSWCDYADAHDHLNLYILHILKICIFM